MAEHEQASACWKESEYTMLIGAQLWLFHALMDEDAMEAVLTRLEDADYACVETMFGRPPRHRAVLDRVGLGCYATHVALSAMPPGAEVADFAHRLGAATVCVSGLLRWNERSGDDYRRGADALNAWGARFEAEGLALHYHNHDFEFAPIEGTSVEGTSQGTSVEKTSVGKTRNGTSNGTATGMEILLAHLDPAVVSLCFDAGWAVRAGHDPVDFAAQNAPRIKTLHLRDFRGTLSVPLGAGDLDLSRLVPPLMALPNLQAALVEQDPATESPVEDMVSSRRFLQERFGL